ncbi:MAG: SHOCT domain-containing protein [Oribacterium sp.]|nr:SHOCT domain-containing protein [Oribacterium sp.]
MDGHKSVADEIIKLKSLLESGVITEEEFNSQKTKLLSSPETIDAETASNESKEGKVQTVKDKIQMLKPIHKMALIGAMILILFLGYISINGPILTGDNKFAYDLIVKNANKFKNPSSVRITSGSVLSPKDDSTNGEGCLWCGLSGINGFGSRTTSYYWLSGDGETIMEDDSSHARVTDELNYDQINKKLEKKLKGKY